MRQDNGTDGLTNSSRKKLNVFVVNADVDSYLEYREICFIFVFTHFQSLLSNIFVIVVFLETLGIIHHLVINFSEILIT